MASATRLSKNDVAVLGAILDPEAGLDNASLAIEADAEIESLYELHRMRTVRRRENDILHVLNTASPSKADVQDCVHAFDKLLRECPEYASGYNNRAQARRMMFPNLKALTEHPDLVLAILEDLTKAISLKTPQIPGQSVSPEAASVLSSAYTHRGYLFYKASQIEKDTQHAFALIPYLTDRDSEELLGMASRDFALGGRYGNKAAKQLAVHTNPYAKLCGSIVKEALHREIESFQTASLAS